MNEENDAVSWLDEWRDLEFHLEVRRKGFESPEAYIEYRKKEDEEAEVEAERETQWQEDIEGYEKEERNRRVFGGRGDNAILGIIMDGGGDAHGYGS